MHAAIFGGEAFGLLTRAEDILHLAALHDYRVTAIKDFERASNFLQIVKARGMSTAVSVSRGASKVSSAAVR
jgi:hypothetical protein